MPAYEAVVQGVAAVDAINIELAKAISARVEQVEGDFTPDDMEDVIRFSDRVIADAYGSTQARAPRSAIFTAIVQAHDLSIEISYTEFFNSLDVAMNLTGAESWSEIKQRLSAGGLGDGDRLARAWNAVHGPQSTRERYFRSGMLDPQRRWVDPDGYRLSDRVWKRGKDTRRGIERTLARGMRRGDSPVTIARQLRVYLGPDYDPIRYNRDGRVIVNLRGNPNAGSIVSRTRTLARTEVTNAFRLATAQQVSEIDIDGAGVKWALSPSHPEIDICDTLARRSSRGMPAGVYLPDQFPKTPHPQCLCSAQPWMPSRDEVLRQLVARYT